MQTPSMLEKTPDEAHLYEAAIRHLARYAATEMGLARILARRIERWGRKQAASPENQADEIAHILQQAKEKIPAVLSRLKAQGVLDDEAFSASRIRRSARSGKSRRATLAYLAAKGVLAPELPDNPDRELAAACVYIRRRRAGPFGNAPYEKILAAMARGGFSQRTAQQAFTLSLEEAERLIRDFLDLIL